MKIGLTEIALFELVICLLLWVVDDYTASLLCLIIPAIGLGVLIIALIAEWIEPSKVPRIFFTSLAVTILIPVLSLVIYTMIYGKMDWM